MLWHIDTRLVNGDVVVRIGRPFRSRLVYIFRKGSEGKGVGQSMAAAEDADAQRYARKLFYRFAEDTGLAV